MNCGNNSVVEYRLPKVEVAGSISVSRSKENNRDENNRDENRRTKS